jgi:sugar O-acyltransferase (sialic acid O-acetyltransferase NeuD family)
MPTEIFIVIGGGGHACVAVDAWLQAGGQAAAARVFDDNPALAGSMLDNGIRIQTGLDWATLRGIDCHVAVGNNAVRDKLLQKVVAHGGRPRTLVHPRAMVAPSARIGAGCFVAAGAIVSVRAEVRDGAIINHGAVVDHDCAVGAVSHVAPNGTLGGCVKLGDRVLIGAGATVLPGLTVGSDTIIAAGAVLTRNAPAQSTMVGIPAKRR